MTTLADLITTEIRESGPLTFARYMELALYHPELGYYATGIQRTGWRGHFLTAPELGPAFGRLWATGFERIWEACGSPESFSVVEVGPGEGGFAKAVLGHVAPPFAAALEYRLVERVPAVRERQQSVLAGHENVAWSAELDDAGPLEAGCLFANEVVDNLPVHVVEGRDGGIVELYVSESGGELELVTRPPSPEVDQAAPAVAEGARSEVGFAGARLVASGAELLHKGAVVIVDYGDDAAGLAARPGGTLLSYSESGTDDLVLLHPGSRDITSHVNWTTLGAALESSGATVVGPFEQRVILARLGAGELDAELRHRSQTGAGVAVVRALSERSALGVLTDPGALGSFGVLAGLRAIAPPDFLAPVE